MAEMEPFETNFPALQLVLLEVQNLDKKIGTECGKVIGRYLQTLVETLQT